ncbi:hypothetical protein ElyMa_001974600 [Elysia marginata]|uniref:Reverse transcriptase domain-containing protein n=1 Tax=Elysia marginata TaxID=1093978 RepID=A0AAV4F2G2_9GAST|nr:hypothetical protein ElyMa_001974600 [Elysia marginata]
MTVLSLTRLDMFVVPPSIPSATRSCSLVWNRFWHQWTRAELIQGLPHGQYTDGLHRQCERRGILFKFWCPIGLRSGATLIHSLRNVRFLADVIENHGVNYDLYADDKQLNLPYSTTDQAVTVSCFHPRDV